MPSPRAMPGDVRTWASGRPWRRMPTAVSRHADAAGLAEPTARLMNQLGLYWQARGQFRAAEPLMRRALAIDERSLRPDHPDVATRPQQPGAVAAGHQPAGRGRAADAAARWRSTSGATAPTTPTSPSDLNNLAALLQATNRLAEAEPLLPPGAGDRRAELRPRPPQRRHRPQQPGGVAAGHQPAGRGRAAVPPGAGDRRAELRPRPPRRRHRPQQPGGVAAGHQPAGRGRAAHPPGAGDRRAELRPRPPRRRQRPQQPGAVAAGHQPAGRGRAAAAAGRWRSTSGATAPTTPTSPPTSTTWRSCCRPPTGWPRPSRSTAAAVQIWIEFRAPDRARTSELPRHPGQLPWLLAGDGEDTGADRAAVG